MGFIDFLPEVVCAFLLSLQSHGQIAKVLVYVGNLLTYREAIFCLCITLQISEPCGKMLHAYFARARVKQIEDFFALVNADSKDLELLNDLCVALDIRVVPESIVILIS